MEEHNWFNKDVSEVEKELQTDINKGLNNEQVKEKTEKYGLNELQAAKKKTLLQRFLDQFKDMMIIVLLIAAVFSGISSYLNGEAYTDTIVIIAVVLLNAIMGFAQELKADSAVESLKKMTTPNAKVIRNGQVMICSSEKIVPGDILSLEAG